MLPEDQWESLTGLWHAAPRRWGHRLHALCSYMAMFPPTIPHVFIRWLTKPGDVVYDPFSGRGTTALEARILDRVPYASDLNPLAFVLTSAKIDPVSVQDVRDRLKNLRRSNVPRTSASEPREVRMLFSAQTLRELVRLRGELDSNDPVDRYILALLLGILHRRADKSGRPRGLTIAMPNTFSMAPGYIRKYKRVHGLVPPRASPLSRVTARLKDFLPPESGRQGAVWIQDVTQPIAWPGDKKAKLVFTSPPYLGVVKYGKQNWIRMWLLGEDPKDTDDTLFNSGSVERYQTFIRQTLANLRSVIADDGYLCLVIGDVVRNEHQIVMADRIANMSHGDLRWLGTVVDRLPVEHKVSRIWGAKRGRATAIDRVVIFGGPAAEPLPAFPEVVWN